MPAERAGFTVTMFVVDTSPAMAKARPMDPDHPSTELSSLEWALRFVKSKIQDMIFAGRKTDKCGVIAFGSEETKNIVNDKSGGYDNVYEYVAIDQPNSGTIARLDALRPSTITGDPLDALIVGIETQDVFLAKKKTWTRKIVLVTNGESPIEMEDWDAVSNKMNALDISLAIVGVDFDDPAFPYEEPGKSVIKRTNEQFYRTFIDSLNNGMVGTCAFALQEIMRPDIRNTKSALTATVLRLGDTERNYDGAIEIAVRTSKTTATARPKSWKKFAARSKSDEMQIDEVEEVVEFAQLRMRTEYYVDRKDHDGDEGVKMEDEEENLLDSKIETNQKQGKSNDEHLEKVEREELIRGFKYGTTYVPCPDGQFPKLPTRKGIDICGFYPDKNFRREYIMGEISYVWADPTSPHQQAALSSLVQAMYQKGSVAIARLVSRDGMDPKMGVLSPIVFDKVDCFLWAQMPFADDVRKYSFASLEHLVSKKGDILTSHPYLPSEEQQTVMDSFVDAMDLMNAGDKDEEGNRQPWFDTRLSYNPSLHRVKQALLHCAVVPDINNYPLPPPHPELLKYFEPPLRVVKRMKPVVEQCKDVFKVKEVPKRVPTKIRKDGHAFAEDEDDEKLLLLDGKPESSRYRTEIQAASPSKTKGKAKAIKTEDSETEDDDDYFMHVGKQEGLEDQKPTTDQHGQRTMTVPMPARPASSQAKVTQHGKDDKEIHAGRAPGLIIGTTDPLKDFRQNLKRGDVVSKAVKDMGYIIGDIVMRPFAWRRTDELMECLREMRSTALKEDEIDAWNAFMKDFKKKCLGKNGNTEFWEEVKKAGRQLNLISDSEAKQYGGTSTVHEGVSEQFFA
ncbi:hypothetical protein APHAL10511_006571 [Amanita phalloides]|nr:hypothetical protein APHAL10511_006571 [Amanita phalloides]